VRHAALTEARAAFPHGGHPIEIERTTFRYADHVAALAGQAASIGAFKARRQAAFEAERARWKARGLDSFVAEEGPHEPATAIPPGCFGVETAAPGNVWKVLKAVGDQVAAGDAVAIIESMKMEIAVTAHAAGRVRGIRAAPGRILKAGDVVAVPEG
jgi:urea carboxylase